VRRVRAHGHRGASADQAKVEGEQGTVTPFREASEHLGRFRPPFATATQLQLKPHAASSIRESLPVNRAP
jgi:hypothetical protein